MQQILLCDDILIKWKDEPQDQSIQINVSTNRYFLPTDERNLAYKAALLMAITIRMQMYWLLQIRTAL